MLEIRKAVRKDGNKAWKLRTDAILAKCSNHYPVEDLKIWTAGEATEEFLDDVEANYYVAEIDAGIVGTGRVSFDEGIVDSIFVDPKHMGKGIATKMLEFLEKMARENNVKFLKLYATLNAADLYRNLGYRGNKVEKYKSPRGINIACIPMSKKIE